MEGRNPEAWSDKRGGGDDPPILLPSFPQAPQHFISDIIHHRSMGNMWMQPKVRGLGQCWWKVHCQNRHARHWYKGSWMLYWSNRTLPEMPLNSFVSPEHEIIPNILMKRLDAENAMDIDRSPSPSEATPVKWVIGTIYFKKPCQMPHRYCV